MSNYSKIVKDCMYEDYDIEYRAMEFGGECGELLNEIKKLVRDTDYKKNGYIPNIYKEKIKNEIGDCIFGIQSICNKLNFDFKECQSKNIKKILKRKKKRNEIFGDDDFVV